MKIVFLTHNFPGLGGIESVTILLANYLTSKNLDITIISSTSDPLYDSIYISKKINRVLTPNSSDFNSLSNIRFIENYLCNNRFDIVINQGCAYNIQKKQIPKETKIIQTLHGLPFWQIKCTPHLTRWIHVKKATKLNKLPVLKKLILNKLFPYRKYSKYYNQYKFFISNCDYYVTLCDGFTNIMTQKFPQHSSKIISIENPIPSIDNLQLTNKSNEIIYIGRLSETDKHINRILKLWADIEQKDTGWCIKIVGDGPDAKELISLSKKLNLKRCSFEGFHANPIEYHRNAKIILLTSEFEGVPMSILESMQVGTVPVAYNCSEGMELLIDNGKNGFLIPCFKQKEFENKLLELMNNESLWINMSKQAIVKAQEFDIQVIGEKWIHLFDSMTTSK
ncbi:MAG: glycosyltransferase [Bacteroidales bacterium]